MKQLLLICAVVALVGCGKKKEAPKEENRVKVQRVTPNPELPIVIDGKLITNPIVEKAIRKAAKKPTGELTKADYEKLTFLSLGGNQLTELPKGLEKLTQLTSLALQNNQLTDVKGLEKLTQLTILNLRDNQLTDVKGLEKLTQLTELNLYYNRALTKAQIDELQKALSKCQIRSNPKK